MPASADQLRALKTFPQLVSYLEAELAGGFDGLDGGSAGGADVVHDHHRSAFFLKAFNALSRAVGLFLLAHQEAMDGAGAGQSGTGF